MKIIDDGNIPVLVGEDQDVVFSVLAIVGDRPAVVGVEAFLVFEGGPVRPLQPDFLEHVHLVEIVSFSFVIPGVLVWVVALLTLQLSELPCEEVHRGVPELVEVLSLQDHLLEKFAVFHVSLELRLLKVEQAAGV